MAAPRRVHLKNLADQGDPEAQAELADLPKLPPLASHLWSYWLQLAATRQQGANGPARLTRAEIRLWEEDEGCPLERWERRAVIALDGAWHRVVSEGLASRMKKPPK